MKIIQDHWLSGIFGYDAYKLEISEGEEFIDFDMPSSKAFLYAKVPSERVDIVKPSARLYEQCGFRIIKSVYVLHAHVDERGHR